MALNLVLETLEAGLRLRGIQRKSIDVGPRTISYLEGGTKTSGRTAVFVHGLGSSNMNWVRVLPRLARSHHVVALDLPGYGKSPLPPDHDFQTLREHTQAVVDFVHSDLFQEPVTLAGQSMGGWIATKAARAAADRVEQLVLINSAGYYYDGVEELRALLVPQTRPEVHELWKRLWHRVPAYYKPFWKEAAAHMRVSNVTRFMDTLSREDFINEDLEGLEVPVSIVWGRSDRLIPSANVDELIHELRSTRVYWLAECGHIPPIEAPAAFVRAMHSILDADPLSRPAAPAALRDAARTG